MPNFVPIRPAVWISIENRQTDRQTDIALYVLDKIRYLTEVILFAGKVAKVGATPGVTRAVQTKIRVHDDPLVYLVSSLD